MDTAWKPFIILFFNPYFWIFILFSMTIPYQLKLLRRFYPKSLQNIIIESETYNAEIEKDKKRKRITNKIQLLEGAIIFIPSSTLTLIYLTFSYYNNVAFIPDFFFSSVLLLFSSIMFFSLGIYILKSPAILSFLLKEDYLLYLEIEKKSISIDPLINLFLKYKNIFSYLFILMGLFSLIVFTFPAYFK